MFLNILYLNEQNCVNPYKIETNQQQRQNPWKETDDDLIYFANTAAITVQNFFVLLIRTEP